MRYVSSGANTVTIDGELADIIRERVRQMPSGDCSDFYDPRDGRYVGMLRNDFGGPKSWELVIPLDAEVSS